MVNLVWQPGMSLEEIEKAAILQAFRFYRGNKTSTSRSLGISIRTLDAKLEKYGQDNKAATDHEDLEHLKREQFFRRSRGQPPIANETEWLDARRDERERVRAEAAKSSGSEEYYGKSATDGSLTEAGLHVESASNPSAKLEVPVHVRKEVQGVPSESTSRASVGKRR